MLISAAKFTTWSTRGNTSSSGSSLWWNSGGKISKQSHGNTKWRTVAKNWKNYVMGNFERRLKWSGWSKSTHVFLLKVVINWRNMSSIQGSKQAEHVSEIIFQFCFVLTQWFDKINCSLISCSDGRHFGKMAAQISTATKARRSKEKAPQKCSISTIYVQC